MSIPSNRKLIGMVLDEVLGGQLPAHMTVFVGGRLGTDRVGVRVTRRVEAEGPNEDLLVGYYDADTEGGQAVGTMLTALGQALCYTERGQAMPRFGEQPAWLVVFKR